MGGLSSDGVSHLVPVAEVLALLVGGLITILVSGWKAFGWLRNGWRDDLKGVLNEWADSHETRHQKHDADITDMRKQMAGGLKRAHERIDAVMERLPPT
jgi:hypothetical protein